MCGRFTLRSPDRVRLALLKRSQFPPLLPRFNIAPSQDVLAIIDPEGRRQAVLLQWGLIPSWSTAAKGFINARAETLEKKRSFSESVERRRCLIPADGFFEWRRSGRNKQPYYFQMKNEVPFAFAGIWDTWRQRETSITSCAIITTVPNELLSSIHDRMPVILQPDAYDDWLNTAAPCDSLRRLLVPFPASGMKSYAVSTDVNHAGSDNENLVKPVPPQPERQPSLF